MKTRILAVTVALAAGLAVAGAARAEGKIYVGAKIAGVDVNESGFDPGFNLGVYGGYNLLGKDAQFAADLRGGTLSVEGEATMTVVKGSAAPFLGDWDMTNIAVYAAYRHHFTDNFYLKGKAGIARYDINTDFPPITWSQANTVGTHDSLALGIGAGWDVGPGSIEVELTSYEGDVNTLSAGFHLSF